MPPSAHGFPRNRRQTIPLDVTSRKNQCPRLVGQGASQPLCPRPWSEMVTRRHSGQPLEMFGAQLMQPLHANRVRNARLAHPYAPRDLPLSQATDPDQANHLLDPSHAHPPLWHLEPPSRRQGTSPMPPFLSNVTTIPKRPPKCSLSFGMPVTSAKNAGHLPSERWALFAGIRRSPTPNASRPPSRSMGRMADDGGWATGEEGWARRLPLPRRGRWCHGGGQGARVPVPGPALPQVSIRGSVRIVARWEGGRSNRPGKVGVRPVSHRLRFRGLSKRGRETLVHMPLEHARRMPKSGGWALGSC